MSITIEQFKDALGRMYQWDWEDGVYMIASSYFGPLEVEFSACPEIFRKVLFQEGPLFDKEQYRVWWDALERHGVELHQKPHTERSFYCRVLPQEERAERLLEGLEE